MKRSEIVNKMICIAEDGYRLGAERDDILSEIANELELLGVLKVEPEEKPKKKITVWTWERAIKTEHGYWVEQYVADEAHASSENDGFNFKKVPGSERVIEVDDE